MNESDAKRIVELYKKLEEYETQIKKINSETRFCIACRGDWVEMPIDANIAKGYLNSYYSKEAAGITAQLKGFGFEVEP